MARTGSRPAVIAHAFCSRHTAASPTETPLSAEAEAALRQLSLERLMAYGVHYADAVQLRLRVQTGEAWRHVAASLAEDCLRPPEAAVAVVSDATRANQLYRASALTRISQMMMVSDSDERRAIFARAADQYSQAATLAGDRFKTLIETRNGALVSWTFPVRQRQTIGTAVFIGGVEGWAMDFAELGVGLARRGVEALALDGPGQGESRMMHGHYLTETWQDAYADVFSFVLERNGGLPLAFIGNSIGGALAIHLAAYDTRIVICCDNGGPKNLGLPKSNATFARKMVAHCGPAADETRADRVWRTVQPIAVAPRIRCPLLVVHGSLDPLIPTEDARYIFDWAQSDDKTMVIYSDGDHCIYNHADDKHNLMCDWIADRLSARASYVSRKA
jgi:alpha-beta hydrolase superfamily lysophospholipase